MEIDMEMPTSCQNCGKIFDLNNGCGSDKWYPGTVICEQCASIEAWEIQNDEEIENCRNTIADAEWTIKDSTEEMKKLLVRCIELEDKRDVIRHPEL